jgi:hypothetical protein
MSEDYQTTAVDKYPSIFTLYVFIDSFSNDAVSTPEVI